MKLVRNITITFIHIFCLTFLTYANSHAADELHEQDSGNKPKTVQAQQEKKATQPTLTSFFKKPPVSSAQPTRVKDSNIHKQSLRNSLTLALQKDDMEKSGGKNSDNTDEHISSRKSKENTKVTQGTKRKREKRLPKITSSPSSSSSTSSSFEKKEMGEHEGDDNKDYPASVNQEEEITQEFKKPKHKKLSSPSTSTSTSSSSSASHNIKKEDVKEERTSEEDILDYKAFCEVAEKGLRSAPINIYLLKKPDDSSASQEEPEELSQIPAKKKEEFPNFPWRFINNQKYSLIKDDDDDSDLDNFIEGQLYTGIREGESIYFFQEIGLRRNEWLNILHSQIKKFKRQEKTGNSFTLISRSREPKGAIMFIEKIINSQKRYFAIPFGPNGRFLLNLHYCDPSFGKHYAYNLLASNKQYRAQSFAEHDLDEKKLKSEQAKINGQLQVVREVRAFIPKALTVTDGKRRLCSFSGERICINAKFSFETIGLRCQELLETSEKRSYLKDYAHIDHFVAIEKHNLVDLVFREAFKDCRFELPFNVESISGTDWLFSFELTSKLAFPKNYLFIRQKYDDVSVLTQDLERFVSEASLAPGEKLKRLRTLKINAKNDSGYLVANWRADHLITTKVEYNNKAYWIEGGAVYEIHKDFLDYLNKRVNRLFWSREGVSGNTGRNLLPNNSPLRLLTEFTNEDKDSKYGDERLSENAYNSRIARKSGGRLFLFDSDNIRVVEDEANKRSKVEPCDLLSEEGELIHIKRWTTRSSSLSYLVTQAVSSASILINSQKYLQAIINKLEGNDNFAKSAKKLSNNKFHVVLGIIHKNSKITPSMLPFNAKMDLLRGMLELERMGIKSRIISILDKSASSGEESSSIGSTMTASSSLNPTEEPYSEELYDKNESSENKSENNNEDNKRRKIDKLVKKFYNEKFPKHMRGRHHEKLFEEMCRTSEPYNSILKEVCSFYDLDEHIVEPQHILETIESSMERDPNNPKHGKYYKYFSSTWEKLVEVESKIYEYCSQQLSE